MHVTKLKRSFGEPVEDKRQLAEALHTYVARAGEKLRRQNSACSILCVFLATNRFSPAEPQYHPTVNIPFPAPAQDSFTLAKAAIRGLDAIFKPGFRYKRAGVMLMNIAPAEQQQDDCSQAPPIHAMTCRSCSTASTSGWAATRCAWH